MFGLTLKSRVEEALRRGVTAIARGGFVNASETEGLGLNDDAAAFLHSELLAHQVFALALLYGQSVGQMGARKRWATAEFFLRACAGPLVEEEARQGLPNGALSRVLLSRFLEIEGLSPEERRSGRHVEQSVLGVLERDEHADAEDVADVIEGSARQFYQRTRNVFRV